MVQLIDKYRLPNDNILMWLGTSDQAVNNILILAGGDMLFLTALKTVSLSEDKTRNDIMTLDRKSFVEKYGAPVSPELWDDLKKGVESGEYPPFLGTNALRDYRLMLGHYIGALSRAKDPETRIKILDEIIGDCLRRRIEIERKATKPGLGSVTQHSRH